MIEEHVEGERFGQDWIPILQKPRALGGPGSGNFGHAGRPGEIGGSAPASEASWPISDSAVRRIPENHLALEDRTYEWMKKLSFIERDSIASYASNEHVEINDALRNEEESASAIALEKAKNIEKALETAPDPPPPAVVWRGLKSGNTAQKFLQLNPGDVIELGGFQSSTIDPKLALDWAEDGIVMEIKPKEGAYIRPMSEHRHEYEFLLPHGKQYRYLGSSVVELDSGYGSLATKRVHKLEML